MTDVLAAEIEILREQFSDAAKRYPGLQCCIATWHISNKEPVFCSSNKQTGRKDYFIPEEFLYGREALIYRWNHSPCSAEELTDLLSKDCDEEEREQILEDCKESASWYKKTSLVRRKNETWKKGQAIEHLRVLTHKISDFRNLYHHLCYVEPGNKIDLDYIAMQSELEVYEYGDTDGRSGCRLSMDDDCWFLMRWLWSLFIAARNQTVWSLSKHAAGQGYYREGLPKWRSRHVPYVMKLDDVFLESALLCSRLLNITEKMALKPAATKNVTCENAKAAASLPANYVLCTTIAGIVHKRSDAIARTLKNARYNVIKVNNKNYCDPDQAAALFPKWKNYLKKKFDK